MTHFQFLKVYAEFMSAKVLNLFGAFLFYFLFFLNGFTRRAFSGDCGVIVVSRPHSNPFICPSNTKSNRCAYHDANWLENCVKRVEFFWLSWPFGWEPSAFVCLSGRDGWAADALCWPSPEQRRRPLDQSENYLSSSSYSSGDLWDVNRRSALKIFLLAEFIRAF